MDGILERIFLGNTVADWLEASLYFIGTLFLLALIKLIFDVRRKKDAEQINYTAGLLIRTLVRRFSWITVLVIGANVSRTILFIPERYLLWIRAVNMMTLFFQLGLWFDAVILMLTNFQINKKKQDANTSTASIRLLGLIGRILLWIVMVLMMLDNVPGIQITSLIASLGVTGIAVALAVQSMLGDLFASITIALDQPFKVGDFIEVDDKSGTVEKIGLRSTKLRAISGEVIIVSNRTILDTWVRNYQAMVHRRVGFDLKINYDTPYALLNGIPDLLKKIIESFENAHFERVTFKAYADTGLIFEVVYFIGTKDFNTYMDLCHNINLTIFKRFEDEGITFAVPTQKILLEK